MSMRPIVQEIRFEARAEWDGYTRAVKDRNDMIPGLVEAIRGFEPGHTKITAGLLETRAIIIRAGDPAAFVTAANEMDRLLAQIEKMARANPKFEAYPPFASNWKTILKISRRAYINRRNYNNIAGIYNKLLHPFPQNILMSAFGYTPLSIFPGPSELGE